MQSYGTCYTVKYIGLTSNKVGQSARLVADVGSGLDEFIARATNSDTSKCKTHCIATFNGYKVKKTISTCHIEHILGRFWSPELRDQEQQSCPRPSRSVFI